MRCFRISFFQFRIFTAPFQHVGFADFWLADQLNSLAVALLDLQFIICFYAHDWHVNKRKFRIQWNPINTDTNGSKNWPYEQGGRIIGAGSNFMI